jgi:hypothetical protein
MPAVVDKSYMLEKPPAPGPGKRFLNTVVLPFAIDLAGSGEVALQRLSERSGIRSAVLVAGVAGGAVLLIAASGTFFTGRAAQAEPARKTRPRTA